MLVDAGIGTGASGGTSRSGNAGGGGSRLTLAEIAALSTADVHRALRAWASVACHVTALGFVDVHLAPLLAGSQAMPPLASAASLHMWAALLTAGRSQPLAVDAAWQLGESLALVGKHMLYAHAARVAPAQLPQQLLLPRLRDGSTAGGPTGRFGSMGSSGGGSARDLVTVAEEDGAASIEGPVTSRAGPSARGGAGGGSFAAGASGISASRARPQVPSMAMAMAQQPMPMAGGLGGGGVSIAASIVGSSVAAFGIAADSGGGGSPVGQKQKRLGRKGAAATKPAPSTSRFARFFTAASSKVAAPVAAGPGQLAGIGGQLQSAAAAVAVAVQPAPGLVDLPPAPGPSSSPSSSSRHLAVTSAATGAAREGASSAVSSAAAEPGYSLALVSSLQGPAARRLPPVSALQLLGVEASLVYFKKGSFLQPTLRGHVSLAAGGGHAAVGAVPRNLPAYTAAAAAAAAAESVRSARPGTAAGAGAGGVGGLAAPRERAATGSSSAAAVAEWGGSSSGPAAGACAAMAAQGKDGKPPSSSSSSSMGTRLRRFFGFGGGSGKGSQGAGAGGSPSSLQSVALPVTPDGGSSGRGSSADPDAASVAAEDEGEESDETQPAAAAGLPRAAAGGAAATAAASARCEWDVLSPERAWAFAAPDGPWAAAEWLMHARLFAPPRLEGLRRAMAEASARPQAASSRPGVRGAPPDDGSWETHAVPGLWMELAAARGTGTIGASLAAASTHLAEAALRTPSA